MAAVMGALYNSRMSLQNDIRSQIKDAMIQKDETRLLVLRSLVTSFTNELVAKKRKPDEELSDEDALAVIGRAVKQRKDSIKQFEKGGRGDLADGEKKELVILETFLPPQMSRDEIEHYVRQKKEELNPAADKKNQLMGMIMKDLKGKADGNEVKAVIDSLFT